MVPIDAIRIFEQSRMFSECLLAFFSSGLIRRVLQMSSRKNKMKMQRPRAAQDDAVAPVIAQFAQFFVDFGKSSGPSFPIIATSP